MGGEGKEGRGLGGFLECSYDRIMIFWIFPHTGEGSEAPASRTGRISKKVDLSKY